MDSYFTNISFIICSLEASKKRVGVLMYQSTVFIIILIHYENKYYERTY